MKNNNKQRGDTIVEVLLAMVVVGVALGLSFGIVNRSIAIGRDAQERSEAVKFVEAQLEKLKVASSNPNAGYFNDTTAPQSLVYCIDNALLRVTDTAATCRYGTDGRYNVSIVRTGSVFVVTGTWQSILGDTDNSVKMVYRTNEFRPQQYSGVVLYSAVSSGGPNATISGEVLNQGTSAVTECGFVWSTTTSPSIASVDKQTLAACSGLLSASISGLTAGTTYYVRAYSINSSGTSYSNEISMLATAPVATVPVLGNTIATNVTPSTVTISVSSEDNGGDAYTRRAAVIGTSANPEVDVAGNNTIEIIGGTISADFTGLLPNTVYYARVYAQNSVGSTYSTSLPFTTENITFAVAGVTYTMLAGGTFGNHTYYYTTQEITWTEANAVAQAAGGYLVIINSAAENAFVASMVTETSWLGLTDSAVEGQWRWIDGTLLTGNTNNPFWSPTEPNDFPWTPAGQDYALMNWNGSGNGRWDDQGDYELHRFVIEFDY